MNGPCKCLLKKECFAKRGHNGDCFLLIAPASHWVDGELDCAFRKVYREKPKGWEPKTPDEKAWAEAVRKKVSII